MLRSSSDRSSVLPPNCRGIQFENIYFTEMCNGFEAGPYSRRIDFVYHSTLGLRVIKRREKDTTQPRPPIAGWMPFTLNSSLIAVMDVTTVWH